MGLTYHIQHREGRGNKAADTLFRMHEGTVSGEELQAIAMLTLIG